MKTPGSPHLGRHAAMISRLPLVLLCTLTLLGCKMKTDLPRYEEIAPFDPHRPSFTCEIEATKVPPIDAQADAWFQEARALEDPEIWDGDRDYRKIVQLTKQAADRRHWKAMLNLASLYIEGRDLPHGVEEGVRIVEDAMRLGIPAAYDRMGTFHLNGTGVSGGWPRAYAFFQKAADLGSPDAMAYLGEKLKATWDSPKDDFWANLPVALKMLECGFSQGSGMAAYELALVYSRVGTTREQRTRALKLLHEGVKLGCADCAGRLSGEFRHPIHPAEMLAPHLDTARADRYLELASALRFNPARRFPNLDKVLPLPPAPLPPWDGERASLVKAAMGVSLAPAPPQATAGSQRSGRHFVDPAYKLRSDDLRVKGERAPISGYWRPVGDGQEPRVREALAEFLPGLYAIGEPFPRIRHPDGRPGAYLADVAWERLLTLRHDFPAFHPQTSPNIARRLPHAAPLASSHDRDTCPATGVWQPWIDPDHALSNIVNVSWRQCWLTKGQAFPVPDADWKLALPNDAITWYLLDETGVAAG